MKHCFLFHRNICRSVTNSSVAQCNVLWADGPHEDTSSHQLPSLHTNRVVYVSKWAVEGLHWCCVISRAPLAPHSAPEGFGQVKYEARGAVGLQVHHTWITQLWGCGVFKPVSVWKRGGALTLQHVLWLKACTRIVVFYSVQRSLQLISVSHRVTVLVDTQAHVSKACSNVATDI